ncbi:MAG: TOBE domain-containing protein [Alphaproteobacteria bacterium]|nr:TOBE domain-containing protein [Alphaproteobacteria bacterium]
MSEPEPKVDAMLALRRGGRPLVGRDRIDLLEAVDRHGSITKAAKAVGLGYKAAWDALNAVDNLLPRPVIRAQAGGAQGGGAVVTEDGKALIKAFRLLEARLARAMNALPGGAFDPLALIWSLGMKTSARNAFRCVVTEIKRGPVTAEVVMRLSDTAQLAAVVTADSLETLGIEIGREAVALVKSSFILLAPGAEPPRVSARNRLVGTVSRREDGPINSEIVLDLGNGKTIAALVTRDSADRMELAVGAPACAMFKASHVILAVD